jgi:(1->4)-alpha-D-glucan 1-alpha-D-glucosylmutase
VDPDNRRPVDWRLRREHLDLHLLGGPPTDSLGDFKLWMTVRLLGARGRRPELFTGSYEPLAVGPGACVFLRGGQLLTAVALPRTGADPDPAVRGVPVGRWRGLLTNEEFVIGEAGLPLSALVDAQTGVGVYERI